MALGRIHHLDTEMSQWTTERSGNFFVALVFRFELADRGAALTVARQNLYAALGLVQPLLAGARQLHAVLEQLQTFFQGQIAALKLAHDSFQLFQRGFEILRFAVFHDVVAAETVRVALLRQSRRDEIFIEPAAPDELFLAHLWAGDVAPKGAAKSRLVRGAMNISSLRDFDKPFYGSRYRAFATQS